MDFTGNAFYNFWRLSNCQTVEQELTYLSFVTTHHMGRHEHNLYLHWYNTRRLITSRDDPSTLVTSQNSSHDELWWIIRLFSIVLFYTAWYSRRHNSPHVESFTDHFNERYPGDAIRRHVMNVYITEGRLKWFKWPIIRLKYYNCQIGLKPIKW